MVTIHADIIFVSSFMAEVPQSQWFNKD